MKRTFLSYTLAALFFILFSWLIQKYVFQEEFNNLSITILIITGIIFSLVIYKIEKKRIKNNSQ